MVGYFGYGVKDVFVEEFVCGVFWDWEGLCVD